MLHQVAPACGWGVPGDCLAPPRSPYVVLNLSQRVTMLPDHTAAYATYCSDSLDAGVCSYPLRANRCCPAGWQKYHVIVAVTGRPAFDTLRIEPDTLCDPERYGVAYSCGRPQLYATPPRTQKTEASPAKPGEMWRVRPDCLPAASSLPYRYPHNCARRTRVAQGNVAHGPQ